MILLSSHVSDDDAVENVLEIFQAVGKVIRLNERTFTSNDYASVD